MYELVGYLITQGREISNQERLWKNGSRIVECRPRNVFMGLLASVRLSFFLFLGWFGDLEYTSENPLLYGDVLVCNVFK